MPSLNRYCFALDLKDDAARIAEYENHHAEVWPEVRDSFYRAGIENVELYRQPPVYVTGHERKFFIRKKEKD